MNQITLDKCISIKFPKFDNYYIREYLYSLTSQELFSEVLKVKDHDVCILFSNSSGNYNDNMLKN